MNNSDTIYALASGRGPSGVAVIRLSGPAAGAALEAVTRGAVPPPRRAVLRAFSDPETGAGLDQGLALWMPGPESFTGEDGAELHVHGGRAVIDGVLAALSRIPGCRMAEPGEFTRRALMNGRMDLAQVEGLADLVAAETEAQRRQALSQTEGALSRRLENWRERLMRAAAHLEAAIDFADEDIPAGLEDSVRAEVQSLHSEIMAYMADNRRGERLREGVTVAILGAPNVGKSSLLNALAERDAAIVSELAGTTRDVIEVHLDLGGYPVILADTAGIREQAETIEEEGIRRALFQAEQADIRLILSEAPAWPEIPDAVRSMIDDKSILVLTKADLCSIEAAEKTFPISAKTGAGMTTLLDALTQRVGEEFAGAPEGLMTRARHREALESCAAGLARYLNADSMPVDLAAEELRSAVHALGRITGRVDVEDFLDVIFGEFCIGK